MEGYWHIRGAVYCPRIPIPFCKNEYFEFIGGLAIPLGSNQYFSNEFNRIDKVKKGGDMNTLEQRDGGVSHGCLEKTTGGGASSFLADPTTWVDDERITCNTCHHMAQHMHKVNMPADHFDKIRRENHKANQWMFDIVKIKNGWARAEYMGWQCNGGQRSYLPIDIKHRCDTYKPKQNAVEVNVKEWWE